MTKNEIVARWNGFEVPVADWNFDDYNFLHKSWVKFRDLKFEDKIISFTHDELKNNIIHCIVYETATEAFDELVKGIEWYESLKK